MPRDERRMTFIVVPHDGRDLGTRSFEVSYRRLRAVGVLFLLAFVAWIAMAVSWAYVAAQAARVPHLKHEIARLQTEQAKQAQLADLLRRLESKYEQMRAMLGADRPQDSGSVWLPPAGADSDGAPASGHDPGADSVSFLPSAWPLARRGYVTRGHAGDATGLHPGVDIAVAAGSYIRTAGAGVVEAAGRDSVYGKYVRIRHRDGYESLYAHASQLFVAPNDSVEWHEVIALSGNSGTSTAPHLHFEIWKDGRPVDPIQQVTGDR